MKDFATRVLNILGPNGENWIQNAFSLTAEGIDCDPSHSDAAKFCLLGGMKKYKLEKGISKFPTRMCHILEEELRSLGFSSYAMFNDSSNFEAVKKFVMKVQERLK